MSITAVKTPTAAIIAIPSESSSSTSIMTATTASQTRPPPGIPVPLFTRKVAQYRVPPPVKQPAPLYTSLMYIPIIQREMADAVRDPANFEKRIAAIQEKILRERRNELQHIPDLGKKLCNSLPNRCSHPNCSFSHSLAEKIAYNSLANSNYWRAPCVSVTEADCEYHEACSFVHAGNIIRTQTAYGQPFHWSICPTLNFPIIRQHKYASLLRDQKNYMEGLNKHFANYERALLAQHARNIELLADCQAHELSTLQKTSASTIDLFLKKRSHYANYLQLFHAQVNERSKLWQHHQAHCAHMKQVHKVEREAFIKRWDLRVSGSS